MIQPVNNEEFIRAVLDGKRVQYQYEDETLWRDFPSRETAIADMATDSDHMTSYRIAPPPAVRYMVVYAHGDIGPARASANLAIEACDAWSLREKQLVLKIEVDLETYAIKTTSIPLPLPEGVE